MTDLLIECVEELMYINYASDRDSCPDLTPKSWKVIYGKDVEWMEERYQEDKQKKALA